VRENISVSPESFEMAETREAKGTPANTSAGHLSVHIDGDHPVEVPFLFDQEPKRLTTSFFGAFAVDIAVAFILIWAASIPTKPYSTQAVLPDAPSNQIIWLSQPGPGGGGGGGGNRMKEPPRQAEAPGKDKITVPVAKKAPVLEQQVAKNEPTPEQLNIPAKPLASSQDNLVGVIEAPPGPPTLSQGSGSGGGAGSGTGSGIGPGTGSGLGPGSGGGTGGGVYRPGNGVSLPRVVREVRPNYTSDAMRAKVQGVVMLECVVRPDGTVGDVQVTRSLDSTFGLDQEAIKAAKQWRFTPGTRMGEPVPVLVSIELTFTLR